MKLSLRNFMGHDESDVELPSSGTVVVTGLNGHGKSALVEAFAIGLFGKGLRGARWSPWRPGVKGTVVIDTPEIHVCRSWSGKTKALSWSRPGQDAVDYDTSTKAQDALESVVGTFESWRRTNVFSSSDAAHFTMSTDAERKELLETMLGLGWFDRALDACRKDLKRARDSHATAKQSAQLYKTKLEGHQTTLRTIVEVESSLGEAEIGTLKVDAARVQQMLQDVQGEITSLNEKIRGATIGDGGLAERVRGLERQLRAIDHDDCPTCGQALDQTQRRRIKNEIAEAQAIARNAAAKSEEATAGLREQCDELYAEQEALGQKYKNLHQIIRDIEAATRQRTVVAIQRAKTEADLDVDTGRFHQAVAGMKQHAIEVAELEAVETILGTRGIRAQVLGKTLSGIEALTNSWLERLTSKIQIELRSYTEKKTGGAVDSISLTLIGAGGEHGYLGASAGERRRVDVALLLALAEIASGGPGAPSLKTPIFFDEVFDSLDKPGVEAVGEVLEELALDRCVVVVTHNQDIVASLHADRHLTVVDGKVVC